LVSAASHQIQLGEGKAPWIGGETGQASLAGCPIHWVGAAWKQPKEIQVLTQGCMLHFLGLLCGLSIQFSCRDDIYVDAMLGLRTAPPALTTSSDKPFHSYTKQTNKQNKQTNTDFLQYMFCWGPPVIMLFCSFIFRKWG